MRRCLCLLVVMCGLSGVSLWAQNWQYVATLTSDASGGETLLNVDWVAPGKVAHMILIESLDGRRAEISVVEHIYGSRLILKERLMNDFLAGSRLYQQTSQAER